MAVSLYRSFLDADAVAQEMVNSAAFGVKQGMLKVFKSADVSLREIVAALEDGQSQGKLDAQHINKIIMDENSLNIWSLGFSVYGADGALLFGKGNVHVPETIGNQSYFTEMREKPSLDLIVPDPVVLADQSHDIIMLRRYNKPDGSFAGVVRVALSSEQIKSDFEWFRLGHNGAITLFNQDYILMMRQPLSGPFKVGQEGPMTAAGREFIDQHGSHKEFDKISPYDGMRKKIIFNKLDDLPLYVSVSYARADYLSQWYKHRTNFIIFDFLFILITLMFTISVNDKIRQSKISRQALQYSNNRFSQLVGNISYGVYSIARFPDGGRKFDYVSPRFCEIIGQNEADIIGDYNVPFLSIHPDDLSQFLALSQSADQSKASFMWTGRMVVHGEMRIVKIASTAVDYGGGDRRWYGTVEDITEQQVSLRKLRESDESIRALFEVSSLGVVLTSLDNRIVQFNNAFREMVGYTEQELINIKCMALVDEGAGSQFCVMKVDQLERYGPISGKLIHRDGTFIPVQMNSVKINGADGNPYYWSVFEDITERLRVENELRLSAEQSRLMASSIVDHAIFMLNEQGIVVSWNVGAERIFLYREDEIIGKSVEIFYPDADDVTFNATDNLTRAKLFGKSESEGWHICKDGSRFWASTVNSALYNESGDITGFVKIVRDMTERKKSENSHRLISTLFDKSLQAIMIADKDRNIIDVNRAFVSTTGYSYLETLGRNPLFLRSDRHNADFYVNLWRTVDSTGHWTGEIWSRRKTGEVYPDWLSLSAITNDQGEVTHYVGISTDLSMQKSQEQLLNQIAHYDSLTGIANRVLLAERMAIALARARRDNTLVAICYMDLDGFKAINDIQGQLFGDQLLVEVAKRSLLVTRPEDTVARLGGDEFVVLLVGLNRVEECTLIIEQLLSSISQPVNIGSHTFSITTSIGVSIFDPMGKDGGGDADTLLRHADKAMYIAKDAGKNCCHFYDVAKDVKTREHLQSLKRIRQALDNGEFELYYQPKVMMQTNQVIGAEALIRWNHPERGLVPPMEFLPLIEDTELETLVGEWVMEAALRQMSAWAEHDILIQVSINISASHLQSDGFVDAVKARLARYPDVPRGYLEIEVLESAALQDLSKATEIISACRILGISFALDDFGTGYSSLTYLRSIPAETLKIDQSFVRDMLDDAGDRAIVNGIIVLAQAFNLKVVAEGVETTAHYQALVEMGCQIGQGYGIARPMPVDRFGAWYASLLDKALPTFAR